MQRLEYDGRIGALYWIFIKTLLLSVITLGFYRFWGKANLRRYAWSHMSLQGHRFEYTGTGGELLGSFLTVALLFGLGTIVLSIVTAIAGPMAANAGQFLIPILVVYLIFVGQYAAQNYRLSRTWWCGIKGGMTGSPWRYGIKALAFAVLDLATLNLAAPWTRARLTEDRFNNSYLGNAKATLRMSAKPLYSPYLLGFAGAAIVLATLGHFLWEWGSAIGAFAIRVEDKTIILPPQLLMILAIAYFAGSIVLIITFGPYMAATFRAIADNLQFADLRFSSEVNSGHYSGLWIGNLLWISFTLGLGLPVAVHRSLKFFAQRLAIHGEIDLERLQQSHLERPRFGEGLLEAFDPGLF